MTRPPITPPRISLPRRKPGARPMCCTGCGAHIVDTVKGAIKRGWVIWPGGGHCKACADAAQRVESA